MMSATRSPAYEPGTMIATTAGYYLVEPAQADTPPGYLLARRAERPMTLPRPIRLRDILCRVPAGGHAAGRAT